MNASHLTLDEALQKVGGRHRVQFLALLSCSFAVMHTASFLMSLPLLTRSPNLLCETTPDTVQICTLSEACVSGQNYVLAGDEERSVVFEWRLVCDKAVYVDAIQISCMFGVIFGCFLTGQIGDSLGRRKSLFWLVLCSCVCQFVLYCSASALFFTGVIFLVGLFAPGPLALAAVLLCELTDKRARGPFLTLLCMSWVLGTAACYGVSFYFLSWRPFVCVSVSFGLLFFLLYPWLVESPRFYAVNWGWYVKSRLTFLLIAKRNKRTMFTEKLQGEKPQEAADVSATHLADDKKQPKIEESKGQLPGDNTGSTLNIEKRDRDLGAGQHCSYVDLVKLRTLRSDLVRIGVLTVVIALDLSEALTEITGSVLQRYVQWGVALCVEFAVLLLVSVTGNFAGKKLLMRLSFLTLCCACLSRFAVPEIEEARYAQLGYISACTMAAVAVLQLSIEVPPTSARALFLCAVLSLGCFVWTASRFVIDFIPSHHSAAVLTLANAAGVAATWQLRDTTKKRLKDYLNDNITLPVPATPPDNIKRAAPKDQSFDAFNEEVRGLE